MEKMINIPWAGWEITKFIGSGSFGSVYEIQREEFGAAEKAALKIISIPQKASEVKELYNDGYDADGITEKFEGDLKKIIMEYALMRKMNGSANVVNCDDYAYVPHEDGMGWDIFIRMELLTLLTDSLPKNITEKNVIKIAEDLCKALVLCKKHGIIHRDIKPSNIFVSENGDYKLGDFGIAKTIEQTMGGTVTGTYKYMAPEVMNNQPYGSAADIYSLGLVLYWLLNERRLPFLPLPPQKITPIMDAEAKERRFKGEILPPPAHGSEWLKAIVLKACAYDPKERFASAQEMLDAINAQNIKSVQGIDKEDEQPESVGIEEDDEDLTAGPETNDDDDDSTIGVDIVLPPPPPPPPLWKKILIAGVAAALILAGGLYFFLPKTDTGTVQTTAVSSVAKLEKLADQGDISALSTLAYKYFVGDGVEQNCLKVLECYEKAVEIESFEAKVNIINIFQHSNNVQSTFASALESYKNNMDEDNAHAMFVIGDMYLNGIGTKQDYAAAAEWYEKAAANGNGFAMAQLAVLYRTGKGVAQNDARAEQLYKEALAKESTMAMYDIAFLYMNAGDIYGHELEQDYSKAIEWFKKGADLNCGVCMYWLASMYSTILDESDYSEALAWAKKAAETGMSNALNVLGNIYKNGSYGEPVHIGNALNCYKQAAEQGQFYAMVNMGEMYYYGLGGARQDYKIALEWVEKAREIVTPDSDYYDSLFSAEWITELEKSKPAIVSEISWDFDENTGVLTISGTGEMENYNSSVVPWKTYQKQIKEIVIADGVTKIGNYAFSDCISVIKVSLPESLTHIGVNAFYNCSSMKNITLPEGIKNIGNSAFENCRSLETIEIPENVNTIYGSVFKNCTGLKTLTIHPSVERIFIQAFEKCKLDAVKFTGTREQWSSITVRNAGGGTIVRDEPMFGFEKEVFGNATIYFG